MTLKEFNEINWHRGNVAMLSNGKDYIVKGTKGHGKYLLLYSIEYDKCFIADYHIVESRISDYEEPDEIYQEKKRLRIEAFEAQRAAEREAKRKEKEERKQRNLQEQERIHLEAVARKEAKRKMIEEQRKAEAEARKSEAKKKKDEAKKSEPKPAEKAKSATKAEPIAKAEPAKPAEPVKSAEAVKPAEATSEQPKRKRQRISIARVEKVQFK